MCNSIVLNCYNVSLVVSDSKADEAKNRLSIFDVVATRGNRVSRMIKTSSLVF